MNVESWCPRCLRVVETVSHALWACPQVRDIWLSSPLGTVWDSFRDINYFDAAFHIARSHGEDMFRFLGMISWYVW